MLKPKEDLQAQRKTIQSSCLQIRRQFQELRQQKEQLNEDEIIIHEDFSENFQLKHQQEIMASHWSNESVTVFTAAVYYKDVTKDLKHFSYALISDELTIKAVFLSSTKLSWMMLVRRFLSKKCIIGVMELALSLRTWWMCNCFTSTSFHRKSSVKNPGIILLQTVLCPEDMAGGLLMTFVYQ